MLRNTLRVRRHGLAGLAFVAALATLIAAPAQANMIDISIDQATSMFKPATVTIKAGDTVTWTNPGFVTHTVIFDPKQALTASDVILPAGVTPFASGNLEEDATYSHTFTQRGTYKYVCKLHEGMGMVGTIIVQ